MKENDAKIFLYCPSRKREILFSCHVKINWVDLHSLLRGLAVRCRSRFHREMHERSSYV